MFVERPSRAEFVARRTNLGSCQYGGRAAGRGIDGRAHAGGGSADDVADPLGWALLGVQPAGALSEPVELAAELLELGDAGAKLGGTLLEQAGDVAAGGGAVVAEGDDLADLAECEAERLGGTHEPQAPQRDLVVGAIARWGPGRWGQDADLLVVADRLGRDPRLFGQLTDAHRHLPGTFSHHAP